MNRESHASAFEGAVGALNPAATQAALEAASDLALYINQKGIIEKISHNNCGIPLSQLQHWIGQSWRDTVTVESKPKVDELLREAAATSVSKWREINHVVSSSVQLPVRYCTIALGDEGRVMAIGRDLAAIAALQQELISTQQTMERGYALIRQAETRYRLLFQAASEAVLIADAWSYKVVEANPAAGLLFNESAKKFIGRAFPDLFEQTDSDKLRSMMAGVRASGRTEEGEVRAGAGSESHLVAIALFRQARDTQMLIRLIPTGARNGVAVSWEKTSRLAGAVEHHPEAFVVTDLDRNIIKANSAFLDLAQLATENQVEGQPLERWLGRPGIDVNLLISNLEEHGSVRNVSTIVRGELGLIEDVEVSAVHVSSGSMNCLGFSIREIGPRQSVAAAATPALPRSVEQMTELVGRVPLKDLVRETTDIIERLCIEAALELTGDNRASAAEMLGLSRQSLYSKLRRYGLGDLNNDLDD